MLAVSLSTAADQAREGSALGKAMFKNTFQSGFLSILYSIGSKPLQIWEREVRNGHIKRIGLDANAVWVDAGQIDARETE